MPANPRARKQRVGVLAEASVVRVQHALLRCLRVQVKWNPQRFSRFEDRPKLLFTQIPVSCAAMQHGAVQAEFPDASHQLLRRTVRGRSWQSRKALEPLRRGMNCRRKVIVGRSRQINRDLGIEILDTRRSKRKDRDIDASFVHGIEALGSKIQQSTRAFSFGRRRQCQVTPAGIDRLPSLHYLGGREVLFQRDDFHCASPCTLQDLTSSRGHYEARDSGTKMSSMLKCRSVMPC